MIKDDVILVDVNIGDKNNIEILSISDALIQAQLELSDINETLNSISNIRPECDKTDYILAICSGILCGMFDVFLIGKPEESILGDKTDKWIGDRIYDFAIRDGYKPKNEKSVQGAINYFERKAKIPYDQTGTGGASKDVFGLNPKEHHFQSLGHNPTIVGLFFSILDQFNNTSHFVIDGEVITLHKAQDGWILLGNNFPAKLWCGFVNWVKHLLSDMSGSSSCKVRGMGIPAPFMSWINDLIVLRRELNYPVNEFDINLNEFAIEIFKKGYDFRFQTTQAIPVLINELVVRLIYTIRRTFKYISETEKEDRNLGVMWDRCKPYGNVTVKRMLSVAHGTFCAVDIGDATIRAIAEKNFYEFVLRVNVIGVGRFAVSVIGEIKRTNEIKTNEYEKHYAETKKTILEDYISNLKILYDKYDDIELMTFINNIHDTDAYVQEFNKSVQLAKKRNSDKYLESKKDIDEFFMGGKLK